MRDCKIPSNIEQREFEIIQYAEKLEFLEREFEECEKLNIELDD